MTYSTYLTVTLATVGLTTAPADREATAEPTLAEALRPAQQAIDALVERFRSASVTPLATAQFENELQDLVRALAQAIVAWTYNHLEPDAVTALPAQLACDGDGYRRL